MVIINAALFCSCIPDVPEHLDDCCRLLILSLLRPLPFDLRKERLKVP